jgi:hypothetical protein
MEGCKQKRIFSKLSILNTLGHKFICFSKIISAFVEFHTILTISETAILRNFICLKSYIADSYNKFKYISVKRL